MIQSVVKVGNIDGTTLLDCSTVGNVIYLDTDDYDKASIQVFGAVGTVSTLSLEVRWSTDGRNWVAFDPSPITKTGSPPYSVEELAIVSKYIGLYVGTADSGVYLTWKVFFSKTTGEDVAGSSTPVTP